MANWIVRCFGELLLSCSAAFEKEAIGLLHISNQYGAAYSLFAQVLLHNHAKSGG